VTRRRIGLNLLWMVPGVVGGSEEYTTRLLKAMGELDLDDLELVLFVNTLIPDVYPELTSSFETVVAPLSGQSKSVRVAAENTWLAVAARRRRIELLHHLGGIMPFIRTAPSMVTIHDLQPLAMPAHFSAVKRSFHRVVLPPSARHALRVVTLTDYTRADLIDRLAVDADRIVLVPSGITMPARPTDDADVVAVRRRYGLDDHRVFLYPAITYPHKNHLMVLDAFARVARDHPDAALVLTGGPAQMESDVLAQTQSLGLSARVFRLGRIPSSDLEALYRTAVALVFPSRFEGFGIPVLEAMSRGCPVIAADATALPEVVGDAGVLVEPRDVQGWATAMARLLDDADLRRDLVSLGYQRARRYDWPSAARRLEGVYRSALEEVR
jgi:alpha-1,3-rhamnosyl/mannosyltransferase